MTEITWKDCNCEVCYCTSCPYCCKNIKVKQWIKCTPETMPHSGKNVLVYAKRGDIAIGLWAFNKWAIYGNEYAMEGVFKVIAWMPLPSPPEE